MILLGLGTNLGNRQANLEQAIAMLTEGAQPVLRSVRMSAVYESAALLPEGAPAEWNIPYYNMVLSGTTLLTADNLLATIKGIEKEMGRTDLGHWGPRLMDIDLLAFEGEVRASERLNLPHPHMLERAFVMVPLAAIAPKWWHPALPSAAEGMHATAWIHQQGLSEDNSLVRTDVRLHAPCVQRVG